MTDTTQVPGQLELPLDFTSNEVRTISYYRTTTVRELITEEITTPHAYKALLEQAHARPIDYQRTLRSLVEHPGQYNDVEVNRVSVKVDESTTYNECFKIS